MSSGASDLLGPLLGSPAVGAIFSDHGRLQGMLDFEAALATAEARLGVIPAAAAAPISAKSRAELFDFSKVGRDLSLLMQTDVGEAFEPAGEERRGSSPRWCRSMNVVWAAGTRSGWRCQSWSF